MPKAVKRCRFCKEYERTETMTAINGAFYCSMEHAIAYGLERGEKMREKSLRAKRKQAKQGSLPHQIKLTQMAVNKLVRLLDHGKPCISCGEFRELEAGHYRSVGSMPSLRFDLRQIWGQCRPCNMGGTRSHKRGKNPALVRDEYEKGLRERMGDECVEWINGPHEPKHWSIPGLKNLRTEIQAEIRRLEAGEAPLWSWREFPYCTNLQPD